MAVKYRVEYADALDSVTRIDISDTAYSGSVIELTPAADPLVINMPSGDDIFTPVQGSGGAITVLAEDSDDLRSLYTGDPKKYNVTIYKGGTSTSDIIFYGYVNTGYYSENFNEYDNYEVEIGFNDGLGLLSIYDYLDGGSNYTGTDSVMSVILNMISTIGLDYHDIRVVTDMQYADYTDSSTDTILRNLYVNNANYYDEQDEAMNHREVLDGVLRPLGLVCFTQAGSLWIIDPLKLEESSFTVKIFSSSTGSYSSSESISPNKGVGVSVEYWKTGTQLDFFNGYEKIALEYSGYCPEELTGYPNWSDKSFHSSDGSWSLKDGGDGDDYYRNLTWGGVPGWTLSNGAFWEGTRVPDTEEEEFHLTWDRDDDDGGGDGLVRATFTGDEIIQYIEGQYLKVSFQMYAEALPGYYNVPLPSIALDLDKKHWGYVQKMRIQIGSYYWDYLNRQWTTTPTDSYFTIYGAARTDNMWLDGAFCVPLGDGVGGTFTITIYDATTGLTSSGANSATKVLRVLRMRDFAVSISDAAMNTIEDDTSYLCNLNSEWGGDAPTIELIHGDSTDGVATHYGGFLNSSDFYATDFEYGAMTSPEHLVPVLFKKYASQYQNSRMMLSGCLSCSDIYTSGLAKTGNISESSNLTGKKFILLSGSYHDRDRYIDGSWIEIITDDISIEV